MDWTSWIYLFVFWMVLLVCTDSQLTAPARRMCLDPDRVQFKPKSIPKPMAGSRQLYPFIVSLSDFGGHFCAASLVGAQVAVTACHCILKIELNEPNRMRTTVGIAGEQVNVEEPNAQVRSVVHAVVHHKCNLQRLAAISFDLGAVIFNRTFTLNTIVSLVPVLPTHKDALAAKNMSKDCVVIGWGGPTHDRISESRFVLNRMCCPPGHLQVFNVTSIDDDNCKNKCKGCGFDTEKHGLSCGHAPMCQGESGAPLYCNYDGVYYVIAVHVGPMDSCSNQKPFEIHTTPADFFNFIEALRGYQVPMSKGYLIRRNAIVIAIVIFIILNLTMK